MQGCEEVDELGTAAPCHLSDGFLNLSVPVARTTLEAWVTVEDGRHQANEDAYLGICCTEGINKGAVVGDKVLLPVGPVARVCIVQTQMDDYPVGGVVECLTEFGQFDVGAMPLREERGT